jgi:hypothetical protein
MIEDTFTNLPLSVLWKDVKERHSNVNLWSQRRRLATFGYPGKVNIDQAEQDTSPSTQLDGIL